MTFEPRIPKLLKSYQGSQWWETPDPDVVRMSVIASCFLSLMKPILGRGDREIDHPTVEPVCEITGPFDGVKM
jgi:hypothetical protein